MRIARLERNASKTKRRVPRDMFRRPSRNIMPRDMDKVRSKAIPPNSYDDISFSGGQHDFYDALHDLVNEGRDSDEIVKKLTRRFKVKAPFILEELRRFYGRFYGTEMRVASSMRVAAGKSLLGLSSRTVWHEGDSMMGSTSAMLYKIASNANNSKFYEMLIEGSTVRILYGRLGSDGRSADKHFDSEMQAESFFVKQLKSKLKKGYVSAYSRRGKHRKSGPNYGSYPIGLTDNPGPWRNQDIAYDQAMIIDTIAVVKQAIASFKDDGIIDETAVAMLMSTQRSLSFNRDQLSSHAANELRVALDRIQGTGRAGRQSAEVRTRNAVKGLQKLMRKLNGAMGR